MTNSNGGMPALHSRLKGLAESMRPQLKAMVTEILKPRGLGAKLDPSDLIQDGLVTACTRLDDFQGTSDEELHGWVKAIVRSETLDKLRFWRRRRRDVRREHPQQVDTDASLPIPDHDPSPSRRAMRDEQFAQLALVLLDIPETQRQALLLRYGEGLSVAEIALRLDNTVVGTAGLLKRGVKHLRDRMHREQSDGFTS
jgi:RNA polymerase sigma-70 factor (ECF subfamily)